LVDPTLSISITRQCELLGLGRSSYYFERNGESAKNLELMRLIDVLYTDSPCFGSRKMQAMLVRQGHNVNRKRVQRLMRLMGIEAIYQKPRTTVENREHRKFPYLLRGLAIERPNQVWSTDITYIRLRGGFMYLSAIMDCFSRYVLSWQLSNSLDTSFCIETLETALATATPDIHNSDQGCQYTSEDYTKVLKDAGIDISMDGRGRAMDNIYIERLWRSLKYEEVYLHDYENPLAARAGIGQYLRFYNEVRPHQSLDYSTPAEVYWHAQPAPMIMIV
jgi:putative transposase